MLSGARWQLSTSSKKELFFILYSTLHFLFFFLLSIGIRRTAKINRLYLVYVCIVYSWVLSANTLLLILFIGQQIIWHFIPFILYVFCCCYDFRFIGYTFRSSKVLSPHFLIIREFIGGPTWTKHDGKLKWSYQIKWCTLCLLSFVYSWFSNKLL